MSEINALWMLLALFAPGVLHFVFSRASRSLVYSGPATVMAGDKRANEFGMYLASIATPNGLVALIEISRERLLAVMAGKDRVIVSLRRRLDNQLVVSQVLWEYEMRAAVREGRFDKMQPDRPVDLGLALVPALAYLLIAMGSAVWLASLHTLAGDRIWQFLWYGNAAAVALCGFWFAWAQPALRGFLCEGGSIRLLQGIFTVLACLSGAGAVLFYSPPSVLTILGAFCSSVLGMLLAMLIGSTRRHPTTDQRMIVQFGPGSDGAGSASPHTAGKNGAGSTTALPPISVL